MLSDPLFILMILACAVVAGILFVGVGAFGRGGEFNRKHANRLMRYRIAAQFVAVCVILFFVWMRSG